MDLLALFGRQAAIALDIVERAREARAALAEDGDAALVARVAEALAGLEGERREAAVRLLEGLEGVLGRAGGGDPGAATSSGCSPAASALRLERPHAGVELLDGLDQRTDQPVIGDPLVPLLVGRHELGKDALHVLRDHAHAGLGLGRVGRVLAPLPGDATQRPDQLRGVGGPSVTSGPGRAASSALGGW